MSNLRVFMSGLSRVGGLQVLSLSCSVDRLTSVKLDLSVQLVMRRHPNLLGINCSSWNCIVHCLGGLSGHYWKNLYLLRVMNRLRICKLQFNLLGVINRLNYILGVDSVSWNLNSSHYVVVLSLGRGNSWIKSSSNLWGANDLYNFSVFGYLGLDIGVIFYGVSRDILSSGHPFVSPSNRKSSRVSVNSFPSLSVVTWDGFFSNIKYGILVVDHLSYWRRISLGKYFRLSRDIGYFDFRLGCHCFGYHSWSKGYKLRFSLLSLSCGVFLPLRID